MEAVTGAAAARLAAEAPEAPVNAAGVALGLFFAVMCGVLAVEIGIPDLAAWAWGKIAAALATVRRRWGR